MPLGEATHIITLSLDYEDQDNAKEGSVMVTVRLSEAPSHAYALSNSQPSRISGSIGP